MKYHFEKSVAEKVGVEEAIMLSNIEYWVEKNAANRKHFYDGCYWTYNSKKAYSELFSVWTEKQIRRILDRLVISKLLKKGNYNKRSYDKTLWYTSLRKGFLEEIKSLGPNGQIDEPKWADRSAQTDRPIPNSNPNIKSTVNVKNGDMKNLPNKNG